MPVDGRDVAEPLLEPLEAHGRLGVARVGVVLRVIDDGCRGIGAHEGWSSWAVTDGSRERGRGPRVLLRTAARAEVGARYGQGLAGVKGDPITRGRRAISRMMGGMHLPRVAPAALLVVVALVAGGCGTGDAPGTPPITPGVERGAPRRQHRDARLLVRPVDRRPRARRDGGAPRHQRRPRDPRGGRRRHREPARVGGGRGRDHRRPAGPDARRPRARGVRRRPDRGRLRPADGRHLGRARRTPRPRPAAGSSAATSPATGRRGWSSRSGSSARAACRSGHRRPCPSTSPGG